jgi:hypothetical protein
LFNRITSISGFHDYLLVTDNNIPENSDDGNILRIEGYCIRDGNVVIRHPINKKYFVIDINYISFINGFYDDVEIVEEFNFKAVGYYFRTYSFDEYDDVITNVLTQRYSTKKQISAVQSLLKSLYVYHVIINEKGERQ